MTRKNFIDLAGLIIEMRKSEFEDIKGASFYVQGYLTSLLEREKSFDKDKFKEYITKNAK